MAEEREKQQQQPAPKEFISQPPPPPLPPPPAGSLIERSPMANSAASGPSWLTPKVLLVIFCVINMINYVDRGAMASNGVNGHRRTCDDKGKCTPGTGIQGDFNLNNFEDGVLSSAFMVGLLVASPIFASLAKSHNPFRLIGVGLSVWTLAAAGCGASFDFWSIAICRMFVGVEDGIPEFHQGHMGKECGKEFVLEEIIRGYIK
ncbi:probable sphingolipid transporter spinster homolog 2 [Carica papaya]|uniref:probable sphingolipid transporter spinster homolog 2 n=1 Tax=Carica papaya TaxID=3649 RepID=UPI000B8CBAFC|nr:probable sphingolipid transporter spinster homolog 2 [Carica papaya]